MSGSTSKKSFTKSFPVPSPGEPGPSGALDFSSLNLSPLTPLLAAPARVPCPSCGKSRRYFCCACCLSLVPDTPSVALPLRVEILQSAAEAPQVSTAAHAAILSRDARVCRPWPECEEQFRKEVLEGSQPGSVALLYPSEDAIDIGDAVELYPHLQTLVVIDAKWAKSVKMARSALLKDIPRVKLSAVDEGNNCERATRFWRYSPMRGVNSEMFNADVVRALLSTVEAVHACCEAYGVAKGLGKKGDWDDLLWLFVFNHGVVKDVYERYPGKRDRIMRKSKGLLKEF